MVIQNLKCNNIALQYFFHIVLQHRKKLTDKGTVMFMGCVGGCEVQGNL